MITNWTCLFAYLKYKFVSTLLFLFLRITTLQVLTVLEVRLCKPAEYKLKKKFIFFGGGGGGAGGDLNIINQFGEAQKMEESNF